ncbi:MAG TPA: undecaprenyl/decaprenyl-phosphate alpha-N-acetylglucosaminyl 1-phosphate transferase [Nitrospirae bacterium]|nr:undecaprenyl/decaprenyl-phosphate alpha-N-acetylglucosaminyl 1-phosphate transferase [Nitrospirota bacterium]
MAHSLTLFLAFFTSLIITVLILPRLSNIALKIGLLDFPGQRKMHANPRPLVGGLGMMMALSVTCLLFVPFSNLRGFYAGIAMLAIVGFLDDFRELNHRWKFVAQIVASVFMIYFSNNIVLTFGDIFAIGHIELNSTLAVILTVFFTVGVINAINMIDGLDGLAGGISLIAFIAFAVLAYINRQTELVLLCIALAGAVLGFLKYNWPPSRLFMGDAGSLSLGFSLVFLSISISQKANSLVPPVVPLLVLSVPIVDTITVMIKRMLRGRSPFKADKYHLHHITMKYGYRKKTTVRIILLVSFMFAAIGIIGVTLEIPDYRLFMIFSAYFVLYFTLSFFIRKLLILRLRFIRKRRRAGRKMWKVLIVLIRLKEALRAVKRTSRYSVTLPFSCSRINGEEVFSGTVRDIGTCGFAAELKELILLKEKTDVIICLQEEESEVRFFVTAAVAWLSREDGGYLYGFKFINMDKSQAKVLKNYLESLEKRSKKGQL